MPSRVCAYTRERLRRLRRSASLTGVGKVRDAKNKRSAVTLGEQMARRRTLLEVRKEAAEFTQGLRRGMDPADAVQMILDNMTTAYEYATQNVMELEVDEYFQETITGKRLHPWIVEQERLGLQNVHVAAKASSMGLAERQVRLQEQQAAIFATVFEAVMVEAGLDNHLRRKIHEGIALKLDDIEGTAAELPAPVAA